MKPNSMFAFLSLMPCDSIEYRTRDQKEPTHKKCAHARARTHTYACALQSIRWGSHSGHSYLPGERLRTDSKKGDWHEWQGGPPARRGAARQGGTAAGRKRRAASGEEGGLWMRFCRGLPHSTPKLCEHKGSERKGEAAGQQVARVVGAFLQRDRFGPPK